MSEDLTRWIACDKCNTAQALWQIKLVDGELFFCGHHKNEYADALAKVSYEMVELHPVKTEELVEAE